MELYKDEALCCGCSACASVCPKNAIIMIENTKGFLIPQINETMCVNCGLCAKTCPLQNKTKENHKTAIAVYAGIHKKDSVRQKSRSGGVFMAIAEWIIGQNGVVYGAAFDKDLSVQHMRAETYEECQKFQGSKYVQSDTVHTFCDVIEDLKAERYVLYSGTGCQIDGLIRCLKAKKVNIEKLFTCDIVCHGNVSPKMYQDYRLWYERKYQGKMSNFDFRDKTNGWASHMESFIINNKKYIKRGYTELYYCKAAYRLSCYDCPYADSKRVGDFTLADCWGADKKLPDLYDNKGISLVFANTEKAKIIIEKLSDKLTIRQVALEDFLQPQLRHPIEKSMRYQEFWDCYEKGGFSAIIKTFGKQNPKNIFKWWVKHYLLK